MWVKRKGTSHTQLALKQVVNHTHLALMQVTSHAFVVFFCETGSILVALAILELAGLKLIEICLALPPNAGIKVYTTVPSQRTQSLWMTKTRAKSTALECLCPKGTRLHFCCCKKQTI